MTGAVGAKLLEEALVEAVFGTIGYSLADHFAGEVEVGEDLRQGKGAPVGGELLVDVLDAGFVGDREAGAAAAGDAADLEEAQFVPKGEVGQVVLDGPTIEVRTGDLLVAERAASSSSLSRLSTFALSRSARTRLRRSI